MSTAFSQQVRSAARVLSRVELRPPLREVWALQWEARVLELPLVDEVRVYYNDPAARGGLVAVDKRSEKVLWRQDAVGSVEAVHKDRLICVSNTGLQVVVPETGIIERPLAPGMHAALGFATVGDLLIYETFAEGQEQFLAVDFESGKEVWRWRAGEPRVTCLFAATEEAICFGLDGGPVLALDPRTGRELWRGTVGDFTYRDFETERPCSVQGVAIIHESRVLFPVFSFGVVAYSVKDGKRLWAYRCNTPSATALYDGRYYVLNHAQQLSVLDPATGQVLLERKLEAPVSKSEDVRPNGALLVSESHVFTGSREGYVLAYERETGEFVWGHRPKGGQSNAGFSFASANGRLYYADMSFRVYCLEHDAKGEARLAKQIKSRASQKSSAEAGLAFDVVNVLAGQEVVKEPPYCRPGGKWTVLECRTRDREPGVFFVAEDGKRPTGGRPFAWGRGALWVPTVKDGKALVESFRATFLPREKVSIGDVNKTAAPSFLKLAVFAPGSEEGGWTRTKWTTDGEAEFFVGWNLEEKRGRITEKDEGYRIPVLDLLACLLRT